MSAPEPEFGPRKEIIRSIYEMTPEAIEELAQWLEMRGIRVPVGQVVGYQNDRQATSVEKSSQSITSGSEQLITYDTLVYDATKLWTGSGSGLITPKVPGVYHVVANATWGSQAGGFRTLIIKDDPNNLVYGRLDIEATANLLAPSMTVSALMRIPADGRSIRVNAFQNSGVSVNVLAARLTAALVNRFI